MPDVVPRIPPCHFLSHFISWNVLRCCMCVCQTNFPLARLPCHIDSTCIVCVHTLVLFRLCTQAIQYTGPAASIYTAKCHTWKRKWKEKDTKTEAQPKERRARRRKLCMLVTLCVMGIRRTGVYLPTSPSDQRIVYGQTSDQTNCV